MQIGCSVGGVSFALAEHCSRVTGVDADAAAIAAANTIRQQGHMEVTCQEEGEVSRAIQLGAALQASSRERVSFRQMDPCCLAPDLPEHDVVACINLLERIVSPKAPLGRLGGERPLLRHGGLLLLACTHQWSGAVADRQLWLGGRAAHQGDCTSGGRPAHQGGCTPPPAQAVQGALGPGFELVSEAELPLVQRSNARKYTVMVVHTSVWRRVA